jgi:DNA-binding transcriptional regulator YhcF (GntR family)
MAIMTGVQRTTVSAAAAMLKKTGVIDYTRGHVTILKRDALLADACECYEVIAEQFRELRQPSA